MANETRKMSFDLGVRIRTVRKGYGLSQRELARRSGVTNGTISLIEQNKMSPSVASLKKILDGFPMSLSEFFGHDNQPEQQRFFAADEFSELAGNGVSNRQVGANLANRMLQINHERYGPGADSGEEMLIHAGEEGGIIIRGRIEVSVGGHRRVLGPGDAFYFSSRIPHRFRNLGDEVCEFVSAVTPPSF